VLAGAIALLHRGRACRGDLGVEVDVDRRVREDRWQVGAPLLYLMALGDTAQAAFVATDSTVRP